MLVLLLLFELLLSESELVDVVELTPPAVDAAPDIELPKEAAIETMLVMLVILPVILLANILLKLLVTGPALPAQGFDPTGACAFMFATQVS